MEAQRWRLAMFASDGWFWDDPARTETAVVLRHAARAARLIDGLTEARLEQRLVRDLALLTSPGHRVDGATIYARALTAVGQPGPAGVVDVTARGRPGRRRRARGDEVVS